MTSEMCLKDIFKVRKFHLDSFWCFRMVEEKHEGDVPPPSKIGLKKQSTTETGTLANVNYVE